MEHHEPIFNLLPSDLNQQLKDQQQRTEQLTNECIAIENFLSSFNSELLKYSLEKYELTEIVSTEDVNKAAMQSWDRMKVNLKRFQSDLFGYAKVIQSGSDRLVDRLTMLVGLAGKAKDKPYQETIEIKKMKKFLINGEFNPKDIRPVLEDTNNIFDFYDKVLLQYMKQIDHLLNTVQVDKTWTDESEMRFELFTAGKWMKNFKPLEQPDERFRASAYVVRGVTAQGEKALYYSGPVETKTEAIKDWGYFINVIRNLKLRYLRLTEIKPGNEADNKVDVEAATSIRQRLNYLLSLAKRIKARKGYDQKISTELRKLERSADKIRNNVRNMRTQADRHNVEEEKDLGRPNVSDIVKDLTVIMNAMMQLVNGYNNAIAGQLRLIGALGMVADLELKAYEAPIEKPNPETQDKLE